MPHTLKKQCEEGGVVFLGAGTAATKLKVGNDGRIEAVTVTGPDGEQDILTKAVVIATGSDDGPALALQAGGTTEGAGERAISGPEFSTSRGDPRKIVTTVGAMARQPYAIWVNTRGERFVDENVAFEQLSGNALKRQPGRIFLQPCSIRRQRERSRPMGTVKPGIMAPSGQRLEPLDADLEAEVAGGVVKIAQTWGEIADWMGVPREDLQASIDDYNDSCHGGYDKLFAQGSALHGAVDRAPVLRRQMRHHDRMARGRDQGQPQTGKCSTRKATLFPGSMPAATMWAAGSGARTTWSFLGPLWDSQSTRAGSPREEIATYLKSNK